MRKLIQTDNKGPILFEQGHKEGATNKAKEDRRIQRKDSVIESKKKVTKAGVKEGNRQESSIESRIDLLTATRRKEGLVENGNVASVPCEEDQRDDSSKRPRVDLTKTALGKDSVIESKKKLTKAGVKEGNRQESSIESRIDLTATRRKEGLVENGNIASVRCEEDQRDDSSKRPRVDLTKTLGKDSLIEDILVEDSDKCNVAAVLYNEGHRERCTNEPGKDLSTTRHKEKSFVEIKERDRSLVSCKESHVEGTSNRSRMDLAAAKQKPEKNSTPKSELPCRSSSGASLESSKVLQNSLHHRISSQISYNSSADNDILAITSTTPISSTPPQQKVISPKKQSLIEKEILKTPIINSEVRHKEKRTIRDVTNLISNIPESKKSFTIVPSRLKRKEMVSCSELFSRTQFSLINKLHNLFSVVY